MTLPRIIPFEGSVDAPTFTIRIDDFEIPPSYEVSSIVITRHVNKVSTAEIVLFDGDPAAEDFEVSSSSDFEPGNTVSISMGYAADEEVVFEGIVTGQRINIREDVPATLCVTCKHPAVKLTVGRKTAYFYEKSDKDVIDKVMRDNGISASVDRTNVTHAEMVQYYATDWDFVVTRAEANGMLVFTEDGEVNIAPPDFFALPAISVLYGATVLELEAEMDARTQYQAVDAYAWQPQTQSMERVNGRNPRATAPGNLSSSELARTIDLSSFDIRHAGRVKDVELQEWANAQWLKSQLAKIRGRVRIQGIASVLPGQLIELGGLGDRFNGNAYITGVRHEFNVDNWETDIAFGLDPQWFRQQYDDIDTMPAEGLLPSVSGLQIGIVTALENDPEGEDRVRVRIPMLDETGEGVWGRIASLDAGHERGAFFRPEIGDEVVVGFLSDDPRFPVILGQLNSSQKPAPVVAADVNHEKGFYTRDKLKLVFNDEQKSISIETPASNKIVISDDAQSIVLSDQHGNEIKMDSSGIIIKSASDVTIQAGAALKTESSANTEIKANAQLKASGSAGAELSASGNTVVKGAVVQIN